VTVRTALIAIAFALAPVAPASAAEVSLAVTPAAGVRLGSPSTISGRVTEAGAPLAGRVVALELRRHPYKRAWRRTGITDRTAADGSFSFSRKLDRNHHVRVRLVAAPPSSPYDLPEADTLSPRRNAYVLPAFRLSFESHGKRLLRLRQTYRVSHGVKLTAPTRFYVGPCEPDEQGQCTGTRAPFRAEAETRRVRPGRYRSTATVRIPKSYGGRFQYVSCFVYSPGSGMGDPRQSCPRRFARLG
jgi:hypothetical protein